MKAEELFRVLNSVSKLKGGSRAGLALLGIDNIVAIRADKFIHRFHTITR